MGATDSLSLLRPGALLVVSRSSQRCVSAVAGAHDLQTGGREREIDSKVMRHV